MDSIKRYPVLTAILALCVAAFAAESYFLWSFNGRVSSARNDREAAVRKAHDAEKLNPAPTAENRDAAAKNAEELKAVLAKVKATFQETPQKITDFPADGPAMLLAVNGYVADLRKKASDKGVITDSDKPTFGMALYTSGMLAPPQDKIPAVYKQLKVLEYLLNHLFDDGKQQGQDMKLVFVRRENVAAVRREIAKGVYAPSAEAGDESHNELFTIDPAVTARVPGAVDTLAFEIQFISYSESLRSFLEVLKRFDLPLVIRSIQVEPATTADLAGTTGVSASGVPVKPRSASVSADAKPVVAENLSKFTLVIEYIELPAAAPAPDATAASGTAAPASGSAASATGTAAPASGSAAPATTTAP